jgi:outer membrane biosynthesis protein TonB
MDPRERADAALARARARGAFVVTPESAVSPMDAASTLQIPRTVVSANDERTDDPDATMVVPGAVAHGRPHLPQQAARAENVPAIAQEALTDVVGAPPGIRSRQRRLEDAERARAQRKPRPSPTPQPAPAPPPEPPPAPEPPPQLVEEDGLIPTTKPAPHPRSTLSQRLDG